MLQAQQALLAVLAITTNNLPVSSAAQRYRPPFRSLDYSNFEHDTQAASGVCSGLQQGLPRVWDCLLTLEVSRSDHRSLVS